jgi:hypothetical protein
VRDLVGVDRHPHAGAASVVDGEEFVDVVELGGEPQGHPVPVVARAHTTDRLGHRARDVLDAQRVGVAGQLEGGALVSPLDRPRGDGTTPGVGGDAVEHLVEVGVDARHRRS